MQFCVSTTSAQLLKPSLSFSSKRRGTLDLGLRLFLQKPLEQNGLTKMDVRRLESKYWLAIDGEKKLAVVRRYKGNLRLQCPEHVYVAQGSDPTLMQREMFALRRVARQLAENNPTFFDLKDDVLLEKKSGKQLNLKQLPVGQSPLDIAAHLSHEDFVLMKSDAPIGPYRLGSAAFYHPSAWSPRSKIGHTMLEIHQPVSFNTPLGRGTSLNAEIGKNIDAMLVALRSEHPLWRMNMLPTRTKTLFRNPDVPSSMVFEQSPLTIDGINKKLHLRLEHQVFAKVPETEDVLFSVRTFVYPFNQLTGDVRRHVRSILETTCAKAGMTMAKFLTSAYKGWEQQDANTFLRYLSN